MEVFQRFALGEIDAFEALTQGLEHTLISSKNGGCRTST